MKRKDVLKRLGYEVPASCRVRLIVDSDAKNEADDQYAIIHHLLTPMFDVRGILAAHFENKSKNSGASMEKSYGEIQRILQLAEIEDVPILPGCRFPLRSPQDDPTSEGVEFIIREARRSDPRPLYIAVQGAMTNVAAALNRAPDIASRITVLWNGGGPYPQGRVEFNLMQDADACRAVLESPVEVWQIPQDVYASMEVSLAELAARVRPCGPLGQYLFDQLVEENQLSFHSALRFRTGENWTLGDNTTVAVLLENQLSGHWYQRPAPRIRTDLTYEENPHGKMIRVYTQLNVRLALEDLFAKLRLVYGQG